MTDAHPEYPKINGLYKRTDKGQIISGDYARPEFEFLRDVQWEWTEKVDGTNIRLGIDFGNDVDFIGGRSDRAQIPPDLLARLQELQSCLDWHETFPEAAESGASVTLYGEGYGARIQKGGGNYIPDGVDFVLFDVKVGPYWLSRENVDDVADKLDIDSVPVYDFGYPYGGTAPIDVAERFVHGRQIESRWPGVENPEGLVGRPAVPLFNAKGNRITVKIKYKDYQ